MDTPLPSQPVRGRALATISLATAIALGGGCSKGGLSAPPECRRIGEDPMMPGTGMETPLPTARYAELRSTDGKVTIPVNLDSGLGGAYSGTGRKFERCDPPGAYYVERIALTDVDNKLVATARRTSTSSYDVTYVGGATVSVGAFSSGFHNYASLQAVSGEAPKLSSLDPQTPIMATQGARVTINSAAVAGADDCGIREARWYLTSLSSPGTSVLSAKDMAVVSGDSGSGTLRIPPTLAAGTYVVEGTIITKMGRSLAVRRSTSTDTVYLGTTIKVVTVVVTANPDQDMMAPTIATLEVTPATTTVCQAMTVSLRIGDNKPLPQGQKVTMVAHPLGMPSVRMTFAASGGDLLTGVFTVPSDAPGGLWLVYPTSFQDSTGNETTVAPSGSGNQLTLSGLGLSGLTAPAATFTVQGLVTAPQDGGFLPAPDLAMPAPTELLNIVVDPQTALMVGAEPRVTVTWRQTARLP